MDAQTKISRAIIKLVANFSFYGSAILLLNIRETTEYKTMCTDGRSIQWNREFVDAHSEQEVMGTLVHEIYHVIMRHHLRMGDRAHKKWNIATDFRINGPIKEEGFSLPEGALLDSQYDNMTSERVYDLLPDDDEGESPGWGEVIALTDGNGNPLEGEEKEQAEDEISQMIAHAADEAKKAGQEINGTLSDLVTAVRTPQVDWKSYLTSYIKSSNPDDMSWRKINRKILSELDLCMPAMISETPGPIAIVLDTSGSVSKDEREVFLSELQNINEALKPQSMHVLCVDTHVATCYDFTPYDDITELVMTGGGGTDMSPGFNYIEECLPEVETILCFSDCEFWEWPPEPERPVLWLSTGKNTETPYGTLVSVSF